MQEADLSGMFVETDTEYDGSFECAHPVKIRCSAMDKSRATYIGQRLSLFMETGDGGAGSEMMSTLTKVGNESQAAFADVGQEQSPPHSYTYPVVLEIEGLDEEAAVAISNRFEALLEEATVETIIGLVDALSEHINDGTRSVVRTELNGGEARAGLEWHTDTSHQ